MLRAALCGKAFYKKTQEAELRPKWGWKKSLSVQKFIADFFFSLKKAFFSMEAW